ncbi:hypothetical protein QBC34DRAFT_424204 [Podospora aff. communis PSN243]|uniref:Uncharacterized protein n=1 Tax=Podospora aff. communis PSN243 TaxID=3040156 RepID=A0AAV9GRG5_9PEZI|nr:hypothetical protein QBC34DRAFT_424204 [Podospora aff. communis PSN243]
MSLKSLVLLSISSVLGRCAAAAVGPVGKNYTFWVWGNGIPGLQLFYDNGAAVFTDYETASASDSLVPVKVSVTRRQNPPPGLEGMGYSFSAVPDLSAPVSNAATKSPPFSSATLFVSDPTSHDVGFATEISALASARFGGFLLADGRIFVVEDTGSVTTALYCAFPRKDNPKIWDVRWNVTNDVPERADGVPVSLRIVKFPYKEPERAHGLGTRCRTAPAVYREAKKVEG